MQRRLVLLCAGVLGCGGSDARIPLRGTGVLARYALEAPRQRWDLPAGLGEISGLAARDDGRLLAHSDERAEIYEIDPARGRAVRRFVVGDPAARGDFEGIATGDGRVWLMTGTGKVYGTRPGAAGDAVPYVVHDTKLGRRCELEGLAFDPVRRLLLLPCKQPRERALRASLVVFAWSLDSNVTDSAPRFSMSTAALVGARRGFRPTSIERHPEGAFLVLSSTGDVAELDASGALLDLRRLGGRHPQPEGLTLAPDGILYVADEGRPATLTAYGLRARADREL